MADFKLFFLINLYNTIDYPKPILELLEKWLTWINIYKEEVDYMNGNYYPKRYCCSEKPACFKCKLNCKLRNMYYKEIVKNDKILFKIHFKIPYEDNDLNIKILEVIHKNDYITKEEVIEQLEKNYGIVITPEILKYYGTENLIEPGIKVYYNGIAGSGSIYPKQTPLMIAGIKALIESYKLSRYEITLKDIIKYRNLLYFNELELAKYLLPLDINEIENEYDRQEFVLEQIKIVMIIKCYACAEVGFLYEPRGLTIKNNKKIIVSYDDPIINKDNSIEIHIKLRKHIEGSLIQGDLDKLEDSLEGLKTLKEVVYSTKEPMKIIG